MDTKSSRWKLNWPELIGLVGLIASLVFVGFEIRQNTRVARAEAYRALVTEVNSLYLQWSNPEQVGVMQKALVNPADLRPHLPLDLENPFALAQQHEGRIIEDPLGHLFV